MPSAETRTAPELLFESLMALRDAPEVHHPRLNARWSAISRYLEHTFARDADAADRRQETLIAIARAVRGMRAEGPLQAAKWVNTIHRRKRVDAARGARHDPVVAALRGEPREGEASALDRVADESAPSVSWEAVHAVVTRTLEEAQRAIEDETASLSKRALRRKQAEAAALRLVLRWEAERIEAALGDVEPVGRDRLYKWVERGRPPLLAGLARWEAQLDEDEREATGPIIAALREMIEERRADAGVPREARRTTAREGESS